MSGTMTMGDLVLVNVLLIQQCTEGDSYEVIVATHLSQRPPIFTLCLS